MKKALIFHKLVICSSLTDRGREGSMKREGGRLRERRRNERRVGERKNNQQKMKGALAIKAKICVLQILLSKNLLLSESSIRFRIAIRPGRK